ncbi:hypothetical protein NEOLEDRAFT_1243363 [Neolentinus lepideus HHB14362 ss-1]|uniref:Uncharacterized protein n=1 Tax=Neolentinus lepideus HHB14362 ss-1 TaxID=1314782 RepID=A0A165R254_9AGAM|nr:hypothetical protein NEOLEDRAFT_1243363 [Neolentinus lepideus HHB14362 ss-1]
MLKPFVDPPTAGASSFKVFRETSNTLAPVHGAPLDPPKCPAADTPTTSAQPLIPSFATKELKVPFMTLDQERVTDTIAAGLAISLLGHVLFLKGQVPFPVAQMMRMPARQTDPRSLKKRQDLLSSLDTLTSHLQTTFSVLSSALAEKANKPLSERDGEQVYIMIVLGPSVTAAKARVLFVVDGLEVKLWEERVDLHPQNPDTGDASENVEENDSDAESSEQEDAEDESEGDSEYETASDSEETGSASEPPLSRSPSPDADAASSPPSSPQPYKIGPLSESPKYRSSPAAKTPTLYRSAPQEQSYAEEQRQLRSAERLLSRTLANACAEEDGMTTELVLNNIRNLFCRLQYTPAPTQAHILLRAPRRFTHPAWTPRQMWTSSLENVLSDFLDDSGIRLKEPGVNGTERKKPQKRGQKTEGVFVGCKATDLGRGRKEEIVKEEDEMLWWSWNGKVAGFSDW